MPSCRSTTWAAARYRDQGAQTVQHPERLAVVGRRQTVAQPTNDVRHRRRAAVEHAQQVHERRVLAQAVAEGRPPRVGCEVALDGRAEEELVLRANVRLGRGMPRGFHARREIVGRMQVAADDRVAEKASML